MNIKKTTKTIEGKSKTIKITIERGTWEDEIRLDGMLCGTKIRKVDNTRISIWDGNKELYYGSEIKPLNKFHGRMRKAMEQGAVGLIGNNWFVLPETVGTINLALAEMEIENPKTPEMLAMEANELANKISQEKALEAEAAEYAEKIKNGFCPKCHSYCYGDCSAN